MTKLLLSFILLISGCYFEVQQPEEVAHMVDEFGELTKTNVQNIDIRFGKLGPLPGVTFIKSDATASCYNMVDRPRIRIDPGKWKVLTEPAKTALLWHELYHCKFGKKGHISGRLSCEGYDHPHLMNSSVLDVELTESALDCYREWLRRL